jgi:copper(I)-binding protein
MSISVSRLSLLAGPFLLTSLSLHAAVPQDAVPGLVGRRVAQGDGIRVAQADTITVHDAWARASAGSATTGAAYGMLMGGSQPDKLVGASTPVADSAEVHQTIAENGIMKMRPAPDLPIPAGQMLTLAPGGLHIMLLGLKHPLVAGQSFPLTLTFAHAAPVTIEVQVRGRGGAEGGGMQGHEGMKMP